MLTYYQLSHGIGVSKVEIPGLVPTDHETAKMKNTNVYWLDQLPIETSQCCGLVHQYSHLKEPESLGFLKRDAESAIASEIPHWILETMKDKRLFRVNTAHPNWRRRISQKSGTKHRVHIAGLGDVGGTLLTGLRLLGSDTIDGIGVYDHTPAKMQRWLYEGNQIASIHYHLYPPIQMLDESDLFNCDVFVFCVARQVPDLNVKHVDVRMAQLDANADIISHYAKMARRSGFQGLFAVVSDPVDHLCKVAYQASNVNDKGIFDGNGLFPEQIKGYGLGVMNARAHFYASQNDLLSSFLHEGRVFGPHGNGLVVANSLINYNQELSETLTEQTVKANLAVRETGFKPYIAPALSSGALSILATLSGEWHYSTIFLGGVYFGCCNRIHGMSQEWELYDLPEALMNRLMDTYKDLGAFTWLS